MPELSVQIPSRPTTVEEFLAVRNELATTPQGGAAAFVLALVLYSEDPKLGLQCLTCVIERHELVDGLDGFKGKQPSRMDQDNFRRRIGARPYIARSYIRGTSPENGYALPDLPWTVAVRQQDRPGEVTDDDAKMFVHSSGADSPRPIRLEKNNRGIWKSDNWSSLEVGCRRPVEDEEDDDL